MNAVTQIGEAYRDAKEKRADLLASIGNERDVLKQLAHATRFRAAMDHLIDTLDEHWPEIKKRMEYEQ